MEIEEEEFVEEMALQMVKINLKIDLTEEEITVRDPILLEFTTTIKLEEHQEDKEEDKTEKIVVEILNSKVNEILDF